MADDLEPRVGPSVESCYRRIVESSPEAVAVLESGEVVFVNGALVKFLGAAGPSQVLGRSPFDFVHPDRRQIVENHLRELERGGRTAPVMAETFVRVDGGLVDAEVTAILLPGEDRLPLLVMLRDITERKRAEEAVSRLAAIVESSEEAIVSYGLDGSVTSWNAAAEKLYGFRADEMIGRPYSVSLTQDQWREMLAAVESIQLGEPAKPQETVRRSRGGAEIPVSLTVSPIRDRSGDLAGVATIARDIRERKKAEGEIRIINRLLHQLSGHLLRLQDEERRRIARELHDSTAQTLAALTMNLSLLESSPQVRSDAMVMGLLAESVALAQQCSQEVRSLSYLLHPPLLDELGLASALRTYVEGFQVRTGITVTLDLPSAEMRLPQDVEIALFRIIQEGLSNVHRHSGSPSASIRVRDTPAGIEMELSDEGCGLPPGLLDAHSAAGARLGVGILGMRERAAQLGGKLEFDPPGVGAVVRVALPYRLNHDTGAHTDR